MHWTYSFLAGAAALASALSPAAAEVFVTGDLARQGIAGFGTASPGSVLTIANVDPASPAFAAGLRAGDELKAVNGHGFAKSYAGQGLIEKIKGGVETSVDIERRGQRLTLSFTPVPKPFELIEGVDSYYGVVETSDGARLRTIITKPAGAKGALPAIFFTQWVSCGSIEFRPGSSSRAILAQLARQSGLALIRVERTASGDSEGPACHELDFDTELNHYYEAYSALMKSPLIDPDNVVIMGSSLGSVTAPLLAGRIIESGGKVKGIAIQGGGTVTYLERMINFDRYYLERRPEVDPGTIHQEMLDRIRFQYEYLVNGRDPDAVAADSPAMAHVRTDVRGLGDGEQYGRPYAWHQQLARRNILAAWRAIDAPVLVIFNEYDQFEAEHGHRMIADFVNRWRPGSATYVFQGGIDHSDYAFPSIEDAYADEMGIPVPEVTAGKILQWLKTAVVPKFE